MEHKPFRLGFIGGGMNSAIGNTHTIASQLDNRFVLKAGCFSKNHEINKKTAEIRGVDKSRVYDTWKELLKREKGQLDAICILTPIHIHSEIVIDTLNMGYSVICEKAMANSYTEAKKIDDVAKRNNSFLIVTYNYTGYPMVRELREMIKKGKLGIIKHISVEMPLDSYVRLNKIGEKPKPQEWRLKDGKVPIISLDLGSHLHNMIFFLTNSLPLEVIGEQSTNGFFKQIIDNVYSVVKYSNNIKAQIWYSKSALGNRNGLRVRVYGDKGSAEWFQMNPEELKYVNINGKVELLDRASNVFIADKLRYNRFKSGHPAGFIEAFANYYYDIADCLLEYKEKGVFSSTFIFDSEHAKNELEMLEAISISSKEKKWRKIKSNSDGL